MANNPFKSNAGQAGEGQKNAPKKVTLEGVVCTNPGNPIAPVYKRVYVEKLDANLVRKVDETNLFEFIQASKSQTDLATLQKRFIELGEIPNVNPNMTYSDTVMPSDIHSLYNMVNDVNGSFNQLPESVKAVFGDSQAYLAAILDGSYQSKLAEAFAPKQSNANENETKGENE